MSNNRSENPEVSPVILSKESLKGFVAKVRQCL
jgi:hypothetical protein